MSIFFFHWLGSLAAFVFVWFVCRLRFLRNRPAIRHALWLLVLLRTVSPPLARVPIEYRPQTTKTEQSIPQGYESETALSFNDERAHPGELKEIASSSKREPASIAGSLENAINKPLVPRGSDKFVLEAKIGVLSNALARIDWLWSLCALSLIGTAMITITTLTKYRRMDRLMKRSRKTDERAERSLALVAKKFQLRKTPSLLVLDASITPTLWISSDGTATIVLSKRLLTQLSDAELEQVLAHELAHWCRKDHLIHWMAYTISAIVWWNPIAWLARRELMAVAEVCCDTMVIDRLGSRKIYAQTLLKVVDFLEVIQPKSIVMGTPFGEARSLRDRFRAICEGGVRGELTWISRSLLTGMMGTLVVVIVPVLAQDRKSVESSLDAVTSPELGRDLVAVLGEDRARVAGLPLNLAIDPIRKLVYLTESNGVVSAYDTETLKRTHRMQLHSERALDLALADNGNNLISISTDGKACLWDVTMQPPKKLDELILAKESNWLNMSASATGERVIFRSPTEYVITDVTEGRFRIKSRMGADGFARKELPFHFALSPDGNSWAFVESLGTSSLVGDRNSYRDVLVKLFDVRGDAPEFISDIESKDVESLRFSSDGKKLFGIDPYFIAPKAMCVWAIEGKELLLESHDQPAPIAFSGGLNFSRDGLLRGVQNLSKLEISASEPTAKASDVSLKPRGALDAGNQIYVFGFLGDDILLVSGHVLQRWDWREGRYQERKKPIGHQTSVRTIEFQQDRIFSSSNEGNYQWDLPVTSSISEPQRLVFEQNEVIDRWLASDELITKGRKDGLEQLVGWKRSSDGRWKKQYALSPQGDSVQDSVWCVAKHPTERVIATGHWDSKIRMWDVDSGEPFLLCEWIAHRGHVCNLSFSPDGTMLASVGWDHHTILWETPSEVFNENVKPVGQSIGSHDDIVRSVVWSLDGKQLASGGEDGKILVWDVSENEISKPRAFFVAEELSPKKNNASPPTVGCLAFSKNGERLLSGDGMGRVKIWNVAAGSPIQSWQLPGWVWDVRFSPDDSMVATGNEDGSIYLLRSPSENKPKN